MDNELHLSDELNIQPDDDKSISEAAELDAIVDFYKDKPLPEDSETKNNTETEKQTSKRIYKLKNVTLKSTEIAGKIFTPHIVTALLCIAIVTAFYLFAMIMPGDTEIINNYADEFRAEKEYVSLSNQSNSLTHEVDELKAANKAKKEKLDSINDSDNTKAAIRAEIAEKAEELNTINSQITEKRASISAIDANIAQKATPVVTLNAGKYVIGTNIAAGKYIVTGSGTFSAASSDGVSKYNLTLGSNGHEVSLEKGDIIKINSTTKFTSVN